MSDRSDQKRTKSKSDALEYQKRIEAVRSLLLSGMDKDAIIQNVSELYKVTPRMVYKYIERADKKNQAYREIREADMFSEHISIRRYIRQKAMAAGNLSAALAAAKDEAALMGLYESDRQGKDYLNWLKENNVNESDLVTEFRAFIRAKQDSGVSSGAGTSGTARPEPDGRDGGESADTPPGAG